MAEPKMEWHLTLNEQIIAQGDHKSLSVLFDCLSGVHFAKGRQASWLDKMSASESYDHYLAIKAKELGVDLIWDGPTDLDPAKQNEVVEGWITRGVDVIAVSVENSAAVPVPWTVNLSRSRPTMSRLTMATVRSNGTNGERT